MPDMVEGAFHYEEPKYDFRREEDVFFQVDGGRVVWCQIMHDDREPSVAGWASYERDYGELAYAIEANLEPHELVPGDYVMGGVTGDCSRGDGWTTDDSSDIYPGPVRRATAWESYHYGDGPHPVRLLRQKAAEAIVHLGYASMGAMVTGALCYLLGFAFGYAALGLRMGEGLEHCAMVGGVAGAVFGAAFYWLRLRAYLRGKSPV